MIRHLKGVVITAEPRFFVLDVGGVGYQIYASFLPKIDSEQSVWVHLAVREKSMDLYGFKNANELALFELLVGVSGIGPKSALAILSLTSVKTLESAISAEDTSYLTKVSGIGRKTAQKIIIELKEKIGKSESVDLSGAADAVEVLRSLGYSQSEARDAVQTVDSSITDTSERVKAALKNLSNG